MRGSRLATGEARRGACQAPPIRHGSCRDTFPSGEGFLGWLSSGGAPLRSPRFAHACALRHGGERRRPPAEADGGCSGSFGHAAGTVKCGLSFPEGVGTLGLLAPDPRQRAAWPSGLPFGGSDIGSRARLAEGEPGLRGSRRATGAPRRGACGLGLRACGREQRALRSPSALLRSASL